MPALTPVVQRFAAVGKCYHLMETTRAHPSPTEAPRPRMCRNKKTTQIPPLKCRTMTAASLSPSLGSMGLADMTSFLSGLLPSYPDVKPTHMYI